MCPQDLGEAKGNSGGGEEPRAGHRHDQVHREARAEHQLWQFCKTDSDHLHTCESTALMDDETVGMLNDLSKKKDIYNRAACTMTPSIYDNDYVKKGIVLQLFGGNRKATELNKTNTQDVHWPWRTSPSPAQRDQ